jgi:hypothetical protein|tara:strand:- start:56 stop:976 length:921 start_codon:yes stop_codon:yes gene_type:complete
MNKEAFTFYKSIKKKDNSTELIEKGKLFLEYLIKLCNSISQKGMKDNFIFQWIFNTQTIQEKDIESYCKANIFSAKNSLERIILKLETEKSNEVNKRMLTDFVCDLKPFINFFDKNQDYTWMIMNTNTHISNFYNTLSFNVFWSGKPGEHLEENLALASSTPFIIRQSIEYKIKRILGIDYLLINEKPDIRTTERCFKAIENNEIYYKTKGINFPIIKLIYSWSNTYIHGGYRPNPWQTENAINYVKKLFYVGETSKVNSFSIYASVEVLKEDLTTIKKLTEKSIKKDIKGKLEIKWLNKPELAII